MHVYNRGIGGMGSPKMSRPTYIIESQRKSPKEANQEDTISSECERAVPLLLAAWLVVCGPSCGVCGRFQSFMRNMSATNARPDNETGRHVLVFDARIERSCWSDLFPIHGGRSKSVPFDRFRSISGRSRMPQPRRSELAYYGIHPRRNASLTTLTFVPTPFTHH